MLVLIPVVEDRFPTAEPSLALRRSYAQLFAQAALAAVETEVDNLTPVSKSNMSEPGSCRAQSSLHPRMPAQLHPVAALVVLSIYEYCQRGNVSRMRARGNQAITTAMDISIHKLDSTVTDFSEAQRRAWWMTVSAKCQIWRSLLLTALADMGDLPILKPSLDCKILSKQIGQR
jgi:hypothetical protein